MTTEEKMTIDERRKYLQLMPIRMRRDGVRRRGDWAGRWGQAGDRGPAKDGKKVS